MKYWPSAASISKIWTTFAHRATHAYVLARTGTAGDRHAGLTEFLVDMDLQLDRGDNVQMRRL